MLETVSQLTAPNLRIEAANGVTYAYRRFGNRGTARRRVGTREERTGRRIPGPVLPVDTRPKRMLGALLSGRAWG